MNNEQDLQDTFSPQPFTIDGNNGTVIEVDGEPAVLRDASPPLPMPPLTVDEAFAAWKRAKETGAKARLLAEDAKRTLKAAESAEAVALENLEAAYDRRAEQELPFSPPPVGEPDRREDLHFESDVLT